MDNELNLIRLIPFAEITKLRKLSFGTFFKIIKISEKEFEQMDDVDKALLKDSLLNLLKDEPSPYNSWSCELDEAAKCVFIRENE